MKSITIHGLDDQLDLAIRKRAKKQGISLNKIIKDLLAQSLNVKMKRDANHRAEFMDLFGVWNQSEKKKFETQTGDLAKIDPNDWQ